LPFGYLCARAGGLDTTIFQMPWKKPKVLPPIPVTLAFSLLPIHPLGEGLTVQRVPFPGFSLIVSFRTAFFVFPPCVSPPLPVISPQIFFQTSKNMCAHDDSPESAGVGKGNSLFCFWFLSGKSIVQFCSPLMSPHEPRCPQGPLPSLGPNPVQSHGPHSFPSLFQLLRLRNPVVCSFAACAGRWVPFSSLPPQVWEDFRPSEHFPGHAHVCIQPPLALWFPFFSRPLLFGGVSSHHPFTGDTFSPLPPALL